MHAKLRVAMAYLKGFSWKATASTVGLSPAGGSVAPLMFSQSDNAHDSHCMSTEQTRVCVLT